LFWRQQPGVDLDPDDDEDRKRAVALMNGLDKLHAVQDCFVAATYLRENCGCRNVVAIGYCLGGTIAYLSAAECKIDAAVSYYGVGIQTLLDRIPRINVPMLLHVAQLDTLCLPGAQEEIRAAVAPYQGIEMVQYPDVGHGFARRGSRSYQAAAAELADAKTLDFIVRNSS
jgi:carboxymethylenebutenolidase